MTATMHYVKPKSKTKKPALKEKITEILDTYFSGLQDEKPTYIYNLILHEVELPLIQAVMKFTDNNQSWAAEILGLNRGTFRKKLHLYGML